MRYLHILLTILFLGTLNGSCHEKEQEVDLEMNATIIGEDIRLCACCGGWFIEISDITYRFTKWPDNLDRQSIGEFPINVRIDWDLSDPQCIGDEIDIISIRIIPFK